MRISPSRRIRPLAVLCLVLAWAGATPAWSKAERPEPGLVWNRTALPAVFPLQVRSDPGRDYFLVLRDTATGDPALAAYLVGGRFFRVLVPPGTFTLHFAAGRDWQGEEALFGAATAFFTLDEPLTFEVRGLRTKSGHVVDLRAEGDGRVAALRAHRLALCQRVEVALPRAQLPPSPMPAAEGIAPVLPERLPEGTLLPERLAVAGRPEDARAVPFAGPPRVALRARLCG